MRITKIKICVKPYKLKENNKAFQYVDSDIDNKVTINSKLSFETSIYEKGYKASSIIGCIHMTKDYIDTILYKSYILSWTDHNFNMPTKFDVPIYLNITSNQRMSNIEQLSGIFILTYTKHLQKVQLQTLAYRCVNDITI